MKINNLKTIAATGRNDNQFVGIKILNNQIEFHYPETYDLSDDDENLRKDLLSIIRTVSLAKTKTSDLSSYYFSHNQNNVFPLSAYLWIINDYLVYGRYENREKVFSNNPKGRVNWKKTLRSNPMISGKNIVYSNLVYEYRDQIDNILSEIYLCCVKQAMDNIGWLYGLKFDSEGIDYDTLYLSKQKYYINVINTELSHTFEDNKKIRLNNMKNIISGLDENMINAKEIIYGVDSYDYVYERMVDHMFSNIENISDFYPSASWDLIMEKEIKDSTNLRPDTVVENDGKIYILDAKYYRYGTTFQISDIPETTSIQKQITYGEYIKKVKNGKYDEVYSAFIMPYSKTRNINHHIFNKNIEYVGTASAKWIDSEKEYNRKIAGVLVDTKYLVDNWIRKDMDNADCLIETLETNIKRIGKA